MANRLKFILIIGFTVCCGMRSVYSQDVHFSQFYANPLYLNPAFAGSRICPRIITNFREQWPSVTGDFMSYSASFDQHFKEISGGIGVLFLGDQAAVGTVRTNAFSMIYSYALPLTQKVAMRMALQATFQQKTLDWTKLTFGDMIDPKFGFVYETREDVKYLSKGLLDFSLGMIIYSDKVYGGVAVNHFTQPKEGFLMDGYNSMSNLPMKITAHGGAVFNIKQTSKSHTSFGDMSISPNLIFQYQAKMSNGAAYTTLNVGTYYNVYPLTVGLWYRMGFENPDAVIALFGFEYDRVKLGYSYDITISKFTETGGAHEVSLQIQLPCPEKTRRIHPIKCPKF
ncbi:MAG: type IX secretion system membrane protein PorP/SprF [Bacteroidales bacterium]|nr:type IX secretion system membrane protein PorP/SprF [Bacteroidales bacterium]